jgi:hypothetical protein
MKLRHLLILGILLFMNGFVCTVLFLMVSREMARPVPTPTEVLTVPPTVQPTSTPARTPTTVPTPTNTRVPPPTYTPVVMPSTPTATATAAPPTPTSAPQTVTATATAIPATATPTATTPAASPTPTASPHQYSMLYIEYQPNCGITFIEGTVWGPGGTTQRRDARVKVWTAGWEITRVTPTDEAKGDGYYDVTLGAQGPRAGSWFVAVVDASGNPLSEVVPFDTDTVDCEPTGAGHQWVIVDFLANY